MNPVNFDGAIEVGKPKNATDEQCFAMPAKPIDYNQIGADGKEYQHRLWLSHWMPSKEDLEALNAGRGFWIQNHCGKYLTPISVLTLDEKGKSNDAD